MRNLGSAEKAPATSPNSRTPSFDLDSVYGAGPAVPRLYDPNDPIKFQVETGGLFEDLPRDPVTSAAIIADPRNDENLILAGMQAAFLLQQRGGPGPVAKSIHFGRCRLRKGSPAYDLPLPLVDPQGILAAHHRAGDGGRHPGQQAALLYAFRGRGVHPVEFQIVYRFGHSMVRPSYQANLAGDVAMHSLQCCSIPPGKAAPTVDLRGGAGTARRFVGWQTFFDFGDGEVKPNKRIDTTLHAAVQPAPGRH